MKRIFTLAIFLTSFSWANAQEAPNFTINTTHGEEITLYDLLDQGKTVVIDIFFVDCPPCNAIAPSMQELNMKWGDGQKDVFFMSLTDIDTNDEILPYEELHSLTFPAAGTDGGGTEACAPYIAGDFGAFLGYPTITVINPDKTMTFDIWIGGDIPGTIELIDGAIANSGAELPVSSVFEAQGIQEIIAFPNPVVSDLFVNFELEKASTIALSVFDAAGRLVLLQNGKVFSAGVQSMKIDFSNQATGSYFVELKSNDILLGSFNVVK